MAVAAPRRRADRDEDRRRPPSGAGEVGREEQPLLAHVLGDELGQPRLEDRHLAAPQRSDLAGVLVDAGHDMAEVGKAGAGDQADITRADHGNAHALALPSGGPAGAGRIERGMRLGSPAPEPLGTPAAVAHATARWHQLRERRLSRPTNSDLGSQPLCRRL